VPMEVADLLTRILNIPTIGIGAGPACDGQILVIDDLLGKFPDFKPRFVRTYADIGNMMQEAVKQYATDILSGEFPNPATEAFSFPIEHLEDLRALEGELVTPEMIYETC
jgi:3-methyl-2-oxobutanoate hydroxymethyltransferase